jgi:peptidoglycan/xylan/chitin deacetylase (PgdA/CDA1 family)
MASETLSAMKMARNWLLNRIDVPIIVLIYHRVTSLPFDPQMLAVTPENFRAHMQHLKANLSLARFEEGWAGIKRPAVVVTFDDGYADNALEALPILEEVGVPATFFISTGNINTSKEFWWDELERIILCGREIPDIFDSIDGDSKHRWPTGNDNERWKFYHEIHKLLKGKDTSERDRWLVQLRRWAEVGEGGRETHMVLTDDLIRRLSASRWATIGAHTISHTSLSVLSATEQEEEIMGSKRTLEELTGKKVLVFSYPFGGRKDYTLESMDLCRRAGFIKTAAGISGQAHRWTDPHQIPRQCVRNWPVNLFARQMDRFMFQ